MLLTRQTERATLVKTRLAEAGLDVEVVHGPPDPSRLLGPNRPLLLVLDLSPPVCPSIRLLQALEGEEGPRPPVIVLADQIEVAAQELCLALDLGADDFVTRLEELPIRARLRARSSGQLLDAGAETSAALLHIRCFGSFRVERGGMPLIDENYRNRKAKLLLKYLLTHYGRRVCKEELLELLWPDLEPDAGMNNLHGTVHMLRRLLANPQYIVYADGCFYFNTASPHWLDVQAFRQAINHGAAADRTGDEEAALAAYSDALSLYRGHFLEEDRYHDWSAPTRERLRDQWLCALARVAEIRAGRGEYAEAIAFLRTVIEEDPLRESAYQQLMRCLFLEGRRNEALQLYLRLASLLQEELGVSPMEETRAVRDAIARGDLG